MNRTPSPTASPSAASLPRPNTPPEQNPREIIVERLKKTASLGSMGKISPGKSLPFDLKLELSQARGPGRKVGQEAFISD